jgi:Prolyl oligopeptidase family
MRLLEQVIRHYEHHRWSAHESRRSHAFAWGLEHVGGRTDEPDPRGFLDEFVNHTLAASDDWFATSAAEDYRLAAGGEAVGEYGVLNFTSTIHSPWPCNNVVHARFFPAKNIGPAVVVLPQWNSNWDSHVHVCRWLNAWGITALRMSLPYHDRRALDGLERDNYLVGPNIGLTLQANRQAVTDVRRCLRWLEQQGYGKLGILGTSVGSCIAFVTIAHEPAIRAGGFLHVSTYFGSVVPTGLTTMHVWEPLRAKVTPDEIQHYWAPISPFPYVQRLGGSGQRLLLVSARYDPTFLPEFSEQLFTAVRNHGVQAEMVRLPCGHYSLDRLPFNLAAGLRFGSFLFEALA